MQVNVKHLDFLRSIDSGKDFSQQTFGRVSVLVYYVCLFEPSAPAGVKFMCDIWDNIC